MSKFDLTKLLLQHNNGNSVDAWKENFLIHLLTARVSDASDWAQEFGITPRTDAGSPHIVVDVEVKVNGVEVPFESFVERLKEVFETLVDEQAKKLVDERAQDVSSALYVLKRAIDKKTDELFPGYRKDDD